MTFYLVCYRIWQDEGGGTLIGMERVGLGQVKLNQNQNQLPLTLT